MRRGLVITVVVGLFASVAAAQGGAPLELLWFIAAANARLDRLQHRLDALEPVRGYANLDTIQQVAPGQPVAVNGWAFVCNDPDARAHVVVDGIELTNRPQRYERRDVNRDYDGTCAVPSNAGVFFLVDMRVFGMGFNSDHRHTFRVRVYDAAGRMYENVSGHEPIAFPTW